MIPKSSSTDTRFDLSPSRQFERLRRIQITSNKPLFVEEKDTRETSFLSASNHPQTRELFQFIQLSNYTT